MRWCSLQVLAYHIVPGVALSSLEFEDGLELATLLPGQNLTVGRTGWDPFAFADSLGFTGLINRKAAKATRAWLLGRHSN